MLKIIGKYWSYVIIVILIILLSLDKCGKYVPRNTKAPDTTYVNTTWADTTYKDSLIVKIKYAVKNVEVLKASKERLDSFSKASKNYDSLLGQYDNLKNKYLSYNKKRDTIRLPNEGYVALDDVVSENEIIERQPTILSRDKTITIHDSTTTTITKFAPPTRKILLGGEFTGNTTSYVNGVNGIFAYQDRGGRQYQLKAGFLNINKSVSPQYGAGLLWTIKLKK